MGIIKKIVLFLENKADYWYVFVTIFIVLEISNYSFLGLVIPQWGCTIVTFVLLIVFTLYISIVYRYFKDKCKDYVQDRKSEIIIRVDKLEEHICELNKKQVELEKELAKTIKENIEARVIEATGKIETDVQVATNTLDESVSSTKERIISFVGDEFSRIVEHSKQQYMERTKYEEKHFEKIDNHFAKQNETSEKWIEDQKQYIQQSTDKISVAIDSSDVLLKQGVSDINERLEKVSSQSNKNSEELRGVMQKSEDRISDRLETKKSRDEEIYNQSVELLEKINISLKDVVELTRDTLQSDIQRLSETAISNHSEQKESIAEIRNTLGKSSEDMKSFIQNISNEEIELCNVIGSNIDALSQHIDEQVEKQDLSSREVSQNIIELINETTNSIGTKIGEAITEETKNSSTISKAIQNLAESVKFDFESICQENSDNTDSIIQEIKIKSQNNQESFSTIKQNVSELQDIIRIENDNIGKQLKENTLEIEGKVVEEATFIKDIGKQNHMSLENNMIDKLNEVIVIGNRISESVEIGGEAISDVRLDVDTAHNNILEITRRIETGLQNSTESISNDINNFREKMEIFDASNVERIKRLSDEIAQNEQYRKGQIELFSSKTDNIQEVINSIFEATGKLEKGLRNSTESISNDISSFRDKVDLFDASNTERITKLVDIISQNEQKVKEQTERLSLEIVKLHTVVTKNITQVLDGIENFDENSNTSYNRIFNQVTGFSNSLKKSLDKILQELEEYKQYFEKEIELYTTTSKEQLEQSNEIKNDILESTKMSTMYQTEVKSRIDNLQSQILSLNSLSEVLKNVNVESSEKKQTKKINPNRVEEIVDKETGIVVNNKYRNNKLVSSEMLTNKKKTYDVEYGNSGQIIRTRNYGQDGSVVTELQFYPNGQVKTRIERVEVNGIIKTETTDFDEKGNKK